MVQCSESLKDLYRTDFLPLRSDIVKKTLTAVCASSDIEIPASKMVADSLSLEENLCSKESLDFGACESAIFKIKVADIDESIVGKEFTVTQGVNSTYTMPYGLFTVESCQQKKDSRFKEIAARDRMKWFDVDVKSWYDGLNLPMNLKAFRISLYEHIGIPYEDVTLPNDNMIVTRNISANTLQGKEVLRCIMQINGCFGHINRTGTLRHIVLPTTVTDTYVSGRESKKVYFEEYDVLPIDKIKISQEDADSEDDAGVIYGTGSNCYVIQGNFLTYGMSASELTTVAQNASTNIFGRAYSPITESEFHGQPYWEVGDLISDGAKSSYILQRTLSGFQALKDYIVAQGTEAVTENHSVGLEITKLNGKSAVIKRDVEGVKSTVSSLNSAVSGLSTTVTNMSTTVEQTSEGLSAEVSAREELQTRIFSANACDEEPIEEDDICNDDSETLTSQLMCDYEAKMLLLKNQFNVSITDNVANLQGQIDLTSEHFTSTISDMENDISAIIEELVGEINLMVTKDGLCNELNLSTDGLNFTGNRFTWTADNSGMSADGTLWCNNANIGGTISTNGLRTVGTRGTIQFVDGFIEMWALENKTGSHSTYASGGQLIQSGNRHDWVEVTSSMISVHNDESGNRSSYIAATDGKIDGATILTATNYDWYCAPITHYHSDYLSRGASTDSLKASKHNSPTYSGAFYVTFDNTSGDENITTVGWVKAKHASDVRLKENFCELDIYKEYMKLNPVEYQYKDGIINDMKHFGFKAQDLAEMFLPNQYDLVEVDRECITYGERKYVDDYVMRINYENMHAMHVSMIQKHEREIQEMQKRIDALEEIIRKLVK